ncbi:MAG: glycoside hydrolase family 10 protein [Chitinophagaceae bacterium]
MKKLSQFAAILICFFYFPITGLGQKSDHLPVRGTWVTNVASQVLHSRAAIRKAVEQSKQAGLNTLFVVVWNGGYTLYPSQVQRQHIGVLQHPDFLGRDPLKEIIEEGHRAGLKVHAWFEFGFSYAYKDTNSLWLKKYPAWCGRNNRGELLQKNGFYWWNALHPGPQALLQSLILEVVKNYEIDGIQGDDRLPAMPAEGGFDSYTRSLFLKENPTKNFPDQPKDSLFIQWKANHLSAFGKKVYDAVKSTRKDCIVSWAPSIFPWSKEEYLQDWPAWLKGGYADWIIPQLYRYNLPAYEKILKQLRTQIPDTLMDKVFPGVLTSLGDGYQADADLMKSMIRLNRENGFNGEVFFYFETLNRIAFNLYQ